jgi:hypothetical protein
VHGPLLAHSWWWTDGYLYAVVKTCIWECTKTGLHLIPITFACAMPSFLWKNMSPCFCFCYNILFICSQRGLLNDGYYAESFSQSRWQSSTWGPRRIKQASIFSPLLSKRNILHPVTYFFTEVRHNGLAYVCINSLWIIHYHLVNVNYCIFAP